ncbi:MAG: RNA polymerase sigma-70 factor [Bacteroidota bacterium]
MKLTSRYPDFKNPIGLKLIYEQYAPKLYNYALRFSKDEQMAKEVVQEVFVTLWEKRDSITIEGNLEAYLVKLAKFKLIDHHRKIKRLEKLYASVKVNESEALTPEDHLAYEGTKATIFNIFKGLPKKAQRIFLLSRKAGMTNKEIATNLNISEKTVEYHIKKSLKRFRDSILSYE